MLRYLVFIFFILTSITAFSATTWTNGQQIIKHIIWKPSYHGFYVAPETYHDPNTCGDTTNLYLIDNALNEKEVDRLYAMLLLGFSSKKTMTIWVNGCRGKYPTFSGLQINF